MFEYLSRNQESIQWQRLQLLWGDERCVPPDQDESNYKAGMLARILENGGENYPAMGAYYPASMVEAKHGEVFWMVDQDAALAFNVSPPI